MRRSAAAAAYDSRHSTKGGDRTVRRGIVRGTRARGSAPRRRFVSCRVRPHRGSRRLGLDGSIAAAGRRHARRPSRRRGAFTSTRTGPICTSRSPERRRRAGAIEAAIFAGVPVNVTLLFSREQYLAAADAYMRGIERRIAAGLDPRVSSVASLFVSRWDRAVADKVPQELAQSAGHRHRNAHLPGALRAAGAVNAGSDLAAAGAREAAHVVGEHRHEGSKGIPPTLYVEALAAPDTIDTMPEKTLLAFAEQGSIKSVMPTDGGDAEAVLGRFTRRRHRSSMHSRATAGGRRGLFRQVLDRTDAAHRGEERGAGATRESPTQSARRPARASRSVLVDVPRLITAYYSERPDPGLAAQRVAFGTSGHRGTSFDVELQRISRARDHPGDLRTTASNVASTDRCSSASTRTPCRRRPSRARSRCWRPMASRS